MARAAAAAAAPLPPTRQLPCIRLCPACPCTHRLQTTWSMCWTPNWWAGCSASSGPSRPKSTLCRRVREARLRRALRQQGLHLPDRLPWLVPLPPATAVTLALPARDELKLGLAGGEAGAPAWQWWPPRLPPPVHPRALSPLPHAAPDCRPFPTHDSPQPRASCWRPALLLPP